MKVVETLHDVDYRQFWLPMLVIYEHPKDYPDKFVVRVWDMDRPTNIVLLTDTLEEARAAIPPQFVRMARSESDDAVIVENYI